MSPIFMLASLAAVDLLSILSSGPNILLVMKNAAERGRSVALTTGYGILTASLIWAGLALMGLTALFEIMPSLQTVLRLAGAAYLVYPGVRLMRSSPPDSGEAELAAHNATHSFLQGFITGILNPKSLTYFATIFVLFVSADASPEFRASAFAVVAVDGLIVYGLAALLFFRETVKRSYLALRRLIDRICGAVMMGFAGKLAFMQN
jgi:threonine efflux protein